jgi:putative transcriptional regulator
MIYYKNFSIKKCKVHLTKQKTFVIIYVKLTLRNVLIIARYILKLHVKVALHGGDILKNRLEEIRNEKGINQEDLAKALSVSRQTISSLENGRYNPSILLAFKIAKYFSMSIEDIFIYEEDLK